MTAANPVNRNPFVSVSFDSAPEHLSRRAPDEVTKKHSASLAKSLQGRAFLGDVSLCFSVLSFLGGYYKEQIQKNLPSLFESSLGKSYGKYWQSKQLYLVGGGFALISLCLYRLGIFKMEKVVQVEAEKTIQRVYSEAYQIFFKEMFLPFAEIAKKIKSWENIDQKATAQEVLNELDRIKEIIEQSKKPNAELEKMRDQAKESRENLYCFFYYIYKSDATQDTNVHTRTSEELLPVKPLLVQFLDQINQIRQTLQISETDVTLITNEGQFNANIVKELYQAIAAIQKAILAKPIIL